MSLTNYWMMTTSLIFICLESWLGYLPLSGFSFMSRLKIPFDQDATDSTTIRVAIPMKATIFHDIHDGR
jgi:hypothetical protein